ncbi:MAG: MBL fold metallo-hydrolase [Deltaproteobacteria bacterium]|nr:MBL fold metallo-hydrolase [Deltaproteobacteria bacterium]
MGERGNGSRKTAQRLRNGSPSLQFLGATQTVTGSKFLLRTLHEKWLIDCGLFQGLKDLRLRNWAPLPVPPSEIDGVLLTHAHIDHSGYIPLLVKQQFRGRVYASEPTVALCGILLPDCGYLQEEDARYAGAAGFSKHAPPLPLYTYQDALRSLASFHALHNGDLHRLGRDLRVRFMRAGHVLGSRFIQVTWEEPRHTTCLFVGDIGRYDALLTHPPHAVAEADYIVLEATYGDHAHPKEDVFARFAAIINAAAARGGKVLIPAFAVGRTQEMLYVMKTLRKRRMIPDIPVYLNTPLGIDATDIYLRYAQEHRIAAANGNGNGHLFDFPNCHFVHDEAASKQLNALAAPAIIIAGSGMLTGGRMLHHLKAYGKDAHTTLVLVGYQAEGTRGRAIADGARSIKIHGEEIPVRCRIEHIESLSAHGDRDDILRWLKGFHRPPRGLFLVHGEPESTEALATVIRETLHWPVHVPNYLEEVPLT